MNFLKKIINSIKNYKKSFFTINQTELTRFSKLLMVLFFITSLWLIAMGIESSIRQTISPQQKYGYQCERFASKVHLDTSDFEKSTSRYHDSFGSALVCQELEKKYTMITDNHHIQSEISQIRILRKQKHNISAKKSRLNREYSNMLLEKISEQSKENSILHSDADTVKKELDILGKKEQDVKRLISQKSDIMNYPLLQEFKLLVD